jgi:hypothetical protein
VAGTVKPTGTETTAITLEIKITVTGSGIIKNERYSIVYQRKPVTDSQ